MKKVVIINGSAGVGKDTFSSICSKYCKAINFSSVDKVKELATICGWDGIKDEKGRRFLSDMKTALSRYNDLPFKSMKEAVDEFHMSDAELIFLHIREPDEIARAAKEFDAVTLLIENSRIDHITSNIGDANVYDFKYDCTIKNNGTLQELESLAVWFIEQLKTLRR